MDGSRLVWMAAAAAAAACGNGSGSNIDAPGNSTDAPPAPYCQPKSGTNLKLTEVASGLNRAVGVAAPVGDPRVFAIEQIGRIRVIRDGNLLPDAYIDLTNKVNAVGSEQGLLGLAFHPSFATNGRVFVFYTSDPYGDLVISEFGSTPTADVANPAERVIMTIERRSNQDNHNGGSVVFGTDGFLYISVGDGGAADNYLENGQNPQSRMGKVLRIDVDGAQPFAIPPSNPWAAGGGVPEMFAWGLRNPWRISIDPMTNDLYIGDVGQGWYEEINFQPASNPGRNFGWAIYEGPDCFTADPDGDQGCSPPASGITQPIVATDRRSNGECSVVAGHVYRGTCMPDMAGVFFFGDYCGGTVRTLRVQAGAAVDVTDRTEDLDPEGLLYQGLGSFGIDGYNELYVTTVDTGRVYRIEVE